MKKLYVFGDSKEFSVFEVGPGRGDLAEKICRSQSIEEYCLMDIDSNVLNFVKKRLESIEGSHTINIFLPTTKNTITNLSNKFDLAISSHVVEHTPDIKKHIAMMKDKIKQNGFLYLASPNTDSLNKKRFGEKWRAYRDDTHISLHSKKEMEKVLEDFGFEIIVSGTGGLLVGSLLRQGLDSFIWAANDNGDSYNILARLKSENV